VCVAIQSRQKIPHLTDTQPSQKNLQKIFIFLVTFSLFLQLIIIEGHPTHPQDRALHDNETKHKMKGQKMD